MSGPGALTGNLLTFTSAGTVTVRASQAGNANYVAATDVDKGITAFAPPLLVETAYFGSNVTFRATGGIPSRTFRLLASPDVALPTTNWLPVLTNSFDVNGSFNFSNALTPGSTQQFYRVVIP
jgi:hypothetical protein